MDYEDNAGATPYSRGSLTAGELQPSKQQIIGSRTMFAVLDHRPPSPVVTRDPP